MAFSRVSSSIALAICLLIPHHSVAQTPQDIAQSVFKRTVVLVLEDSAGQAKSLGSGFIVANGTIATNYHVISGASRGYAKFINAAQKFELEGVLAIDAKRDLALIKAPLPPVPPLEMDNSDAVQIGDTVYVAGSPRGLEGTFSNGIVSGVRPVDNDRWIQITAPISPGSSGGPVVNAKGLLIGVAVATYRDGQNLNFAVPSNYVEVLKRNVAAVSPLTMVKPSVSKAGSIGSPIAQSIVGHTLTFDSFSQTGQFSFSLTNKLRDPVSKIYCLVIFHDEKNNPVDVVAIQYPGIIPAGLARRITSQVDQSTERLVAVRNISPPHQPKGKVEVRVLDFQIQK